MEFLRGLYIIDEGFNLLHRHIYGHVPALNFLHSNPNASVVGYSRISAPNAPATSHYFRNDTGYIEFMDIDLAEEYVYMRGWDDDNTTTLGNYSTIPGRMTVGMVVQAAKNIMNSGYAPPAALTWTNDSETAYDINRALGLVKPRCDCGGDKCNLPHMRWCSIYKEPE